MKLKLTTTTLGAIFLHACLFAQNRDSSSVSRKMLLPATSASSVNGMLADPVNKLRKELSIKSLIRIDSLFVQYTSQKNNTTDTTTFYRSATYFQDATTRFTAMIGGVPLTAQYQYQRMNGWPLPGSLSAPSVNFNRELFQKNITDRIRSSFNPSSLVSERLAAIQNLKDIALKELQADLIKSVSGYGSNVTGKLKQLGNWDEIMKGDPAYFTRKILGDTAAAALAANEQLITNMQIQLNNHEQIDSLAYNKALKQADETKTLQRVVQVILKYRKKWDESGLVKTIRKMELEKDMQLKQILEDPAVLSKLAKDKLPLQKLERLFLSINKLNTGTGGDNISPVTLSQSLRTSGFSLETLGQNNKAFSATMGKMQELYSVAERSMASGSLMNTAASMAGVSFGKGAAGSDQFSRVTLMSFATSSDASGTNMLSPLSGQVARNLVFTVSRKMKLGSKGSLLTEVSKSAAQSQGDPKDGRPGGQILNTENFFSNLGLSAEYSNEFPSIDLAHEFGFKYGGDGYNNPGNSYFLSGSKEVFNSIDKSFFNRKLVIRVKNRFKTYGFGSTGRYVNNFSNTIDVRWKFKKGNYIALKYQPAYSASLQEDGSVQNKVVTDRIAADLNIRTKISRLQVQHFINLAYLSTQTTFAGLADEHYKTMQLTTMHSVTQGSKQFYVNTNFNYAFNNGAVPYLNSSMLTEAGIVYEAFRVLRLTTACNYNAVQGWYSQIVFKQGIGGQINKKLDINFSIDAASNLKVQQDLPVQNLRSDITVRYLIF
ncbi:hypothetical protein [Sediminibacterium ginsengisoli]|uniref:Uncharacterized protein n=1 Tax=Sediminibacterium ginsengisoli TaxID=413434 RepID=A0A1T4PP28_9BACT|nr:hypothetical protein [Sediminibacterium ginsengisoli]SJZ93189.1 hypothetical protein SAMN04488132_106130 [Sediminibacterium ginsengisoli]